MDLSAHLYALSVLFTFLPHLHPALFAVPNNDTIPFRTRETDFIQFVSLQGFLDQALAGYFCAI
jgi:hypothetical protein